MKHSAIFLSNKDDKEKILTLFFQQVGASLKITSAKKGLIFSNSLIQALIDEERRHDKYAVTTSTNNSVESMSSGEQKIAVLNHLLKQQPEYIILDDWSNNLDPENTLLLRQELIQAAINTLFIQLFYRSEDLLPFIGEVFIFSKENIFERKSISDFYTPKGISISHHFTNLPFISSQKKKLTEPLVLLKKVSVKYGDRPILNNINWTIMPGEFWQLKGSNGSGKTTLISMIIGDNPKAYGQDMYLFGYKKGNGESVWDIKKHIGYFYPAITLFFSRNETIENMLISGFIDSIGLYQTPTSMQQLIAKEWLQLLGEDYQHKKFNELTEGQKRIVLVVRAIIKYPPLLILDEPTAGLDEANTALFISLINTIAATKEMAIIYISHRQEMLLKPVKTLELIKDENGSTGIIK
jgi:molybdate transport system ATP-binding protein